MKKGEVCFANRSGADSSGPAHAPEKARARDGPLGMTMMMSLVIYFIENACWAAITSSGVRA